LENTSRRGADLACARRSMIVDALDHGRWGARSPSGFRPRGTCFATAVAKSLRSVSIST
jgi:hypothetical protein